MQRDSLLLPASSLARRAVLVALGAIALACGNSTARPPGGEDAGGGSDGGEAGAAAGGSAPSYGGFQPSGGTRSPSDGGELGQAGEPSTEPWPERGCDYGSWDDDADTETACVAWTTCPPGEHVSTFPSAAADRTCAVCPDGTFTAHENEPACRPWSECLGGSQQLAPGTSHSDRSCSCLHGGELALAANGRAVCDCPPGTWGQNCEVTTLAVSVSRNTCALRSDHRISCWGHGEGDDPPDLEFASLANAEQLACGVLVDHQAACWSNQGGGHSVPPPVSFTEVAAESSHACGLRTDQTLSCWGENDSGQTDAPPGTFKSVAVAYATSCGIETDGDIACWGYQPWVDAEDAEDGGDEGPGPPPPNGTFERVYGGSDGFCAVAADDTWACWGGAVHALGAIGNGPVASIAPGRGTSCLLATDGSASCVGEAPLPSRQYVDISVDYHACGLTLEGEMVCRGHDFTGAVVPPSGVFSAVAAGGRFDGACGLRPNGEVECWGLGDGSPESAPPSGLASLAVSRLGFCGVKRDGGIACWQTEGDLPAAPAGTYSSVALGHRHAVAITTDGELVAWGNSDAGRAQPPPGRYRSAAAGYFNSCAVRDDGRVLCWVGLAPRKLEPPPDLFESVALGYDPEGIGGEYACGIRSDGRLKCWGAGPVAGNEPAGIYQGLATWADYACALSVGGAVSCWGDGASPQFDPTQSFTQLSFSPVTACGLTDRGRVECRGFRRRPVQ